MLRLLSAGASLPIMVALGEGPLRTKRLTERIPEYVPRTVYRHAERLSELGLVGRDQQPGVPSKVTYRLTPAGRDLFRLLDAMAIASPERHGNSPRREWSSLALLAELWESGLVAELSFGPRSATELARGAHGLTYHQIARRASLLVAGDLLQVEPGRGQGRRYGLTRRTRRRMVLIAGLGRWRQRYGFAPGSPALTADEMATVLRAALPLVRLPCHSGRSIALSVVAEREKASAETLWAAVDRDGALRCNGGARGVADAWAQGTLRTWLAAILDSNRGRMRVGGDLKLVDSCLSRLHGFLWGYSDER